MRPASISAACGDTDLFLAPVSSTLVDHQQTENMVSAIDTGVPPTSNSTTKGKETSRYHFGWTVLLKCHIILQRHKVTSNKKAQNFWHDFLAKMDENNERI